MADGDGEAGEAGEPTSARGSGSGAHDDALPLRERFESLDQLEHLAELEGGEGLKVATDLLEDELRAKSPVRRLTEVGVSLVITVVIFVAVIPKYFNVEYRDVWSKLSSVSVGALAFIVAFWLFTMWSYAGVLTASLPGWRRLLAMVLNFSGSALANVVPFGGAAGVAATYAQGMSWGFDPASITLSIIVSGVWNVFAKLGMPILMLTLLVLTGRSSQGLGAAAIVGFVVLAVTVMLFALVFQSPAVARSVGRAGERAITVARRTIRRPASVGFAERVMEFRQRTVGLVRERWRRITIWMVVYKVSQALLQLMCARAVGIELSWIEVFAVYTAGELLTTIPLTPSGLGVVEAGSADLLVRFGATNEAALAAVLLYRAFTYLFEIPLGAVGWLTWATKHSWRRPTPSR
jgi:uncharacterized protein (TIRG00374 family)